MSESKFPKSAREAARRHADSVLADLPADPVHLFPKEKTATFLKRALDEIDRLEDENVELRKQVADVQSRATQTWLALESENTVLRKQVAERDEALNALARDSRTFYLSVNSAGIYLVCWKEGGVLLGRGPTPLAAIQDAMKKGGAK